MKSESNAFVAGRRILSAVLLAVLVPAMLVACSSAGKKQAYKASHPAPALEVPPDLIKPAQEPSMVLPSSEQFGSATPLAGGALIANESGLNSSSARVQVRRDGALRWLVIKSDSKTVWKDVHGFLEQSGFTIEWEEPRIGLLETDWIQASTDPDSVPARMKASFVTQPNAATRDRFRVRVETGAIAGTTELFITHRGLQQQGDGNSAWLPRATDYELENEVISRLLRYLGVEDIALKSLLQQLDVDNIEQDRAKWDRDEIVEPGLILNHSTDSAWQRIGFALDRLGAIVEQKNRNNGTYLVLLGTEQGDAEGGNKVTQYLLRMESDGEHPRLLAEQRGTGQDRDQNGGEALLSLLQEQLR